MNLPANTLERAPGRTSVPSRAEMAKDLTVAAVLSLLAATTVYAVSGWTARYVVWREFDNLYFQADCSLVYANMTDPASNHYRTGMHPLFSLIMCPAVLLMRAITGFTAVSCVRLLLAANAGALVALGYTIARRIGLVRFDASLYTMMLAASASTVFWATVPETFTFGGTSILVMLAISIRSERTSTALLVFGNVATMSMTLTNWVAGLCATVRIRWGEWRRVLIIILWAAAVVVALGVLSRVVFHSAGYAGDFRRYVKWIRSPQLSDLRSFFAHSVVVPAPIFRARENLSLEIVAEPAGIGTGTIVGLPAVFGWLTLLFLGALTAIKAPSSGSLRTILLSVTGLQLLLHVCFADGPFLFCAHFAPLLVLVAAHASLIERLRPVIRTLTVVTLVLIGYNNVTVFDSTRSRLETQTLPWLERNGTLMAPVAGPR